MPRSPSRQLRWRSRGGASGSGGDADDRRVAGSGSSPVGAVAGSGASFAVTSAAFRFVGATVPSCRAGLSVAEAGGEVMAGSGAPHRNARRPHASGRCEGGGIGPIPPHSLQTQAASMATVNSSARNAAMSSEAILTVEAIPSATRFMVLPPSARGGAAVGQGKPECEFQRQRRDPTGSSCPAWSIETALARLGFSIGAL